MSERSNPEVLLRQAARLLYLAAVSKARTRAITHPYSSWEIRIMVQDMEPTDEVRALAAELLDHVALRPNGKPFNYADEAQFVEAENTEPQHVSLGEVRFKILDPDASAMAVAAGAMEPGDQALAMRVAFDLVGSRPMPCIGQKLVLRTVDPAVDIVFLVALTHDDLHVCLELGHGAERNTDFDALQQGEGLLVQVLDLPEA